MNLLERDAYLGVLTDHLKTASEGMGYTLFISGEAGIGKTSLVNCFATQAATCAKIYTGACDSLFSPRPLGPLYDIAVQMNDRYLDLLKNEKDRGIIFSTFLKELSIAPSLLIFEDVHWADEATLDFIKFVTKRIGSLKCLFLVTYRDDEIHTRHPLKSIFNEIATQRFSKIALDRLSANAVDQLAIAKGFTNGKQIYALTDGNPFYVNEILSSSKDGVPDSVKDSILSVFYGKDERTQALCEVLSILPSRIDFNIIDKVEKDFPGGIDECIRTGIVLSKKDYLCFKHELYRITIEESLSVYHKRTLHSRVLEMMLTDRKFSNGGLARMVHHACFANDREWVMKLAPQAAQESSTLGGHVEAARLYGIAIENTDEQDETLVNLYKHHAYECYLTNQIQIAINSQQKVVDSYRRNRELLNEGDAIRFLSRLWWFAGDRTKASTFALRAIEILENGFPTRERALAYSNMAQLNMLADEFERTLYWGNKAIDLATRMEDQEVLSHALNNVGNMLMKFPKSESEGERNLNKSLGIALEHEFHEHAARAYTNLSSTYVITKKYVKAAKVFIDGLKYCEERDLQSWMYYMQSEQLKMLVETGAWKEAETLANNLNSNPSHPSIIKINILFTLAKLMIRRGEYEIAQPILDEASQLAWLTNEPHRVVPVLCVKLERYWLIGGEYPADEITRADTNIFASKEDSWYYSELAYWLKKCGRSSIDSTSFMGPLQLEIDGHFLEAAGEWGRLGCVYQEALALSNGDEESRKRGMLILRELGATAVYEKVKMVLRQAGVKNIPRGPRMSTLENPANLTSRQVEILELLKDGAQNKEIGERLFISPKTVDHHISAILSKLEVNSRTRAVSEARRLGILK